MTAPTSADLDIPALFAHASGLHAAGRLEEAETIYRALCRVLPDHPALPYNLGLLLHSQGRMDEAAEAFTQSIALRPDYADAYNNLGVVRQAQGRDAEAVEALTQAVRHADHHPAVHRNLGISLRRLGRGRDAVAAFRYAVHLRPDDAACWADMARTLHELKQFEAALEAYRQADRITPNQADILSDMGAALEQCGRCEDAIGVLQRAVELDPTLSPAFNNLGKCLEQLDRRNEAMEAFHNAIRLSPKIAEYHANVGNIHMVRRQIDQGIACYRQAIALRPDFFEAHVSLGMALLTQGHLRQGWAEWEWRWHQREWLTPSPLFHAPLPPDTRLDGKTVLLFGEQGYGDVLQYCRYADTLAERGATVILQVYAPLVRLLRSLSSAQQVIAKEDPEPPCDLRLPMMSAPFVFGGDFPQRNPYLTADSADVARWKNRLSHLPGRRVGLVWAGDPRPHEPEANRIDRRRSLRLDQFAHLADIPGLSLISLQKGGPAQQIEQASFPIFDPMGEVADFADTAALVQNLDLVISADTSMVHLSGAVGTPVWMLSRFDGCWRWGEQGDHSPWYPNLHILRQSFPGEWTNELRRLQDMLTQ